jgi:hypothetical protein
MVESSIEILLVVKAVGAMLPQGAFLAWSGMRRFLDYRSLE